MARLDGIQTRHARTCAKSSRKSARCSCSPSYRVRVDLPAPGGRRAVKSRTFATQAEAIAWRSDALREIRLGTLRATASMTFREAAAEYVAGARDGSIPNRSGATYKPSAVRGIEQAFELRLTPAFGPRKLGEIRRADLQRAIERWRGQGLDPSTIRNTVNAARALYRRAVSLDVVTDDPTSGLALPAVTGRRERVVTPGEAETLLSALTLPADRALWGLAVYAGLRLGEILALTWDAIDLPAGTETGSVEVRQSWDSKEGVTVAPKTVAGRRKVGVSRKLRPLLAAHKLASPLPAGPTDLVFPGRDRRRPVSYAGVYQRADRAWAKAGLESVRPHELRHSYASLMIAAGVREKPLSVFMGHASVAITMDRYGHLFPGAELEGVDLLDRYLSRMQ